MVYLFHRIVTVGQEEVVIVGKGVGGVGDMRGFNSIPLCVKHLKQARWEVGRDCVDVAAVSYWLSDAYLSFCAGTYFPTPHTSAHQQLIPHTYSNPVQYSRLQAQKLVVTAEQGNQASSPTTLTGCWCVILDLFPPVTGGWREGR
jgi:hypothetical protein